MTGLNGSKTGTLVIGAGELGQAVIDGLRERGSGAAGSLSVLLRPPVAGIESDAAERCRATGVAVVYRDLAVASRDELAATFAPFQTIICCTGFVGGAGTQRKITAAVLQAGVPRYVPWQFGVDYDVVGRGSGQEVWDEQADVRAMLRAQDATSWIIVSTGMFTSFLFEDAFGVVDLGAGIVRALGSWDNRLTVTTPGDIGRLTAAILAHQPPIMDQVVYVAGDTFSYAELAVMIETHLGRPVARVLLDDARLRGDLETQPGDVMAKYRLGFARDTGVAWDKADTFNAALDLDVTDLPRWLSQRSAGG
ncbi:NmrA-like family protein [Sphingomonas guangdongensis]|uniref:NmrA-like family protein n=1 Tax=Sphingomonas guangdongensis TaxID=1141890 RepID=A0A285R0Q8_9SPHN|nr:aromatic alcohol reductase [Sphingomonas guangdongensis]SOB87700.1 NmrA-like family protein [Sphingomonas guangdongensis]